jgi:hypothetical protein
MLRTLLALPFLLGPLALATAPAAQDVPIRWGRITDEEVALDSVAGDPDAAAVVLGDVGFAEVRLAPGGDEFEFRLRRHRRVKVLQEAGYEQGEFALRFGESSEVRGVKGQTFVPEPDGSLRRVKLEGRSIIEDDVSDGVREVRFSMPALAPGAIFEWEYTYESENIVVPPVWYFQSDEPTLVSEYRLEAPEYMSYMSYVQGDRVEVAGTERRRARYWENLFGRWTARDVPALREEPYTTTEEDYVHKLELQLSGTSFPNQPTQSVLSSWPKLAEELEDHDEFGRRLRRNGRVEALAASAAGTDEEKARALYDLVRTGYVWDGTGGIFADRDLDDVVEARGGSAGELNLLLLALLREAGVPAQPVLISTRSNGRPIKQYPIVGQFDHVLVLVQPEGGEVALLDATDPHQPYGRLPVEALSGEAWIADPEAPEWLSFGPPTDTATLTMVQGTLADDGRVAGSLTLRLAGYDALDLRARLADEDADAPAAAASAAEEAAAEAADAAEAVDIELVVVKNLDAVDEPVDVESTFSTAAGDVVGDEIYLTPFVVMRLDKNPFERPTRSFPVDFAYPFTRTYVAEIELPEGYAVAELPEPVLMRIPSGAVGYQRMLGTAGPGRVQLRAVLRVAQAQISPEEYPALRRLYDEIVATESEAIVVARTAAPEPAAAAGDAGGDATPGEAAPDEAAPDEAAPDEGAGDAPDDGADR